MNASDSQKDGMDGQLFSPPSFPFPLLFFLSLFFLFRFIPVVGLLFRIRVLDTH